MTGKSMTEGQPWKHIISFALPVFLGSLLQQLYNTADTIIVGNFVNEDALSAVGTTSSFLFMTMALAMGFSAGNGVVVAQHFGSNNEKEVRKDASTGIIMLLVMGIIVSVISFFTARIAYQKLVCVPDSILDLTVYYFKIYSLGLIFQYGYNIFSSILRAIGDSKATLYFLLISSVLNVGLDLLFVCTFKMGVGGAAIATDIAQAVSFVCAYFYMIIKYPIFRFKLKEFVFDTRCAIQTVLLGFPIALQLIIVSCGLTLIQRAVNSFGKMMIAAATVGQRMEMYINLPASALQTTLATYTGQNIGANRMDRVKKGAMQTIIISIIFTTFISLIIYVFASNICALFGLGVDVQVYSNQYLRAIAIVNMILSAYLPIFGLFQGANHPTFPIFVATLALTMRVLATYIFKDSQFFGYSIIWWNALFGFITGFIITYSFYFSNAWMKNSSVYN